jgi:uncharacterized protein (DUF983 family)
MTGIEICPQCSKSDWRVFTTNSTLTTTKRCNACGFESSKTVDLKSAVKSGSSLYLKVVMWSFLVMIGGGILFYGILLGLSK